MSVQDVLDEIRERPGTGDVIPIINPATEEQITEFTDCGPAADRQRRRPREGDRRAGTWRGLPENERAKVLWRVADLIDQHADDLAQLESLNTGMPLRAGADHHVQAGSETFRYYAGWCTKINGIAHDVNRPAASPARLHLHAYTLSEPYGVVGLIFPWNGPVFNACTKLAPALAAGCSAWSNPLRKRHFRRCCWKRSWLRPGSPTASSTW